MAKPTGKRKTPTADELTCPKCGNVIEWNERQQRLEASGWSRFPECPVCGEGTCEECNPGGRGCICTECEESGSLERDLS